MDQKELEFYMCGVGWQHEIEESYAGVTFGMFKDLTDLKAMKKCWQSCGIVKIKVIFDSWVVRQDKERDEIQWDAPTSL